MPHAPEKPGRLILLGPTGLASSGGDVGGVALLTHEATKFGVGG